MVTLDDHLIDLVLSTVAEIPSGKLSTYGDIADMCGYPNHARLVGRIMKGSGLYGDFPCHRVVNNQGALVPGWDEQRDLLADEGITFLASGHADLKRYRWRSV